MKKIFKFEDIINFSDLSSACIDSDGKIAAVVKRDIDAKTGGYKSKIVLNDISSGRSWTYNENEESSEKQPVLLKDGRMLYMSNVTGNWQIFIARFAGDVDDIAGDRSRQLTTLRHGIRSYRVSEDGGQLTFETVLFPGEEDSGQWKEELLADEREKWKKGQASMAYEISGIPYRKEEWNGIRKGERTFVGTLDMVSGEQKLIRTGELGCVRPYAEEQVFGTASVMDIGLGHNRRACIMGAWNEPEELWVVDSGNGGRNERVRLTNINQEMNDYLFPEIEDISSSVNKKWPGAGIWLVHPKNEDNGPVPAVLWIREEGDRSPSSLDYGIWDLVSGGMAVILADPGEIHDEQEREDLLMEALDHAVATGVIDERRIGITGRGFGGYTAGRLLGKKDRFSAAVIRSALVDPATAFGTCEALCDIPSAYGDDIRMLDLLRELVDESVTAAVDSIDTPLLIMHGYRDSVFVFQQAEQFFVAMKDRRPEIPSRLIMFPGEDHGIEKNGKFYNRISYYAAMKDWFQRYLGE